MPRRHVPRRLAIIVALGLAAASCGGHPAPAASAPPVNSLTVKSCMVEGLAARCGTLIVPEDRLTGQGRTIPVRFVVFPATGRQRAPDPVVYFAGGPGDSAVGEIPSQLDAVLGLIQNRDLVFIDQRGTGGSNGLTCPSPPNTLADQSLVRGTIEACLASLQSMADLRFYTSAMTAGDVAQVLTALGYGQVNLFGVSYGATAAQVFQRLFPGRVRTMTLLSGTLLSIPYFEQVPRVSQQALDSVFARCASDPACHGAFPHLASEWAQLRASLTAGPVTVPAAQSPTGTAIQLDNAGLAFEIHQLLTGADSAVYVPLLIHTLATAKNRAAGLAAGMRQLQAAGLMPSDTFLPESVISYPIRCAEPWARYQPGQIADPGSYYYQYIQADAQFWQYVCTLTPAPGAAASYGPPKPSNVPVLMINGTADPQDPPANMSGAQAIWPNSRLLAEPGQSHEIDLQAFMQCDAGLIQAFVEHANAKQLNASCLTQVALPAFPTQ